MGDLASTKAAVSISLERTEQYEHLAKREKVRVERDARQRQVRTKIGIKSQYIEPYCKTCTNDW